MPSFPKWATAKQIEETTEYLLNNFEGDIKVPQYMVWPDTVVPFEVIPWGDFHGDTYRITEDSYDLAGKVLKQWFPYIKQSGIWIRAIVDKVVHDANHKTPRTCCLCHGTYFGNGWSPWPIIGTTQVGYGPRACDKCNVDVVMPARKTHPKIVVEKVCEGADKS
jgi:hypothetical protein